MFEYFVLFKHISFVMAQLFYDFSRALTVGAIFLVENHGGKEPKIEMFKSHRFSR